MNAETKTRAEKMLTPAQMKDVNVHCHDEDHPKPWGWNMPTGRVHVEGGAFESKDAAWNDALDWIEETGIFPEG